MCFFLVSQFYLVWMLRHLIIPFVIIVCSEHHLGSIYTLPVPLYLLLPCESNHPFQVQFPFFWSTSLIIPSSKSMRSNFSQTFAIRSFCPFTLYNVYKIFIDSWISLPIFCPYSPCGGTSVWFLFLCSPLLPLTALRFYFGLGLSVILLWWLGVDLLSWSFCRFTIILESKVCVPSSLFCFGSKLGFFLSYSHLLTGEKTGSLFRFV